MLGTLVTAAASIYVVKTAVELAGTEGFNTLKQRVSDVKSAVKDGVAEAEAKKQANAKKQVLGGLVEDVLAKASPEEQVKLMALLNKG